MNAKESLIDQLEGMLADKDLSRRAEVLRRVTDLFVQGSGKFSDEQIELFDDVMSKLIENIELAVRVGPRRPAGSGLRRTGKGDTYSGVRRCDRGGCAGSGALRAAR